VTQRQPASNPLEAIAEPRRRLVRAGIVLHGSVFTAPEGIRPEVWRVIGSIFLIEGARSFERHCADDVFAARDDGQTERWLPVLRAIIKHRNFVHQLVTAEPTVWYRLDGIEKWPRLADYLFALDRSLDRIEDTLRRSLIGDYLEDRLTDEQQRVVKEMLEAHHDPVQVGRDIDEVARGLGCDTSADVVPLKADTRGL
jgi:hypothetical protein